MTTESCTGGSPWKSGIEVTKAALGLDRAGVSVVGLTDQQVLEGYAKLSQIENKPASVINQENRS